MAKHDAVKGAAKPDLSVVIPCYNEEKNLSLLADAFAGVACGRSIELILVDNGSTDGSACAMKELSRRHSFIKIVTVKKNLGYGFGIWSGLKEAEGEFLCWTHADLQAPPADTVRALGIAQSSKSPMLIFVKGRRTGRGIVDSFFTFGMSVFCSIVLGKWVDEINAQPNLFHRSFMQKLAFPPKDFSFDLYCLYTAKKEGLSIARFPVVFGKRMHGYSSWNIGFKSRLKFIARVIDYTLKLRKSLR